MAPPVRRRGRGHAPRDPPSPLLSSVPRGPRGYVSSDHVFPPTVTDPINFDHRVQLPK